MFKKLLKKLIKESIFSANNRLIKQINVFPMRGPISVVFSDISMCPLEEDVAKLFKPILQVNRNKTCFIKRLKESLNDQFDREILIHFRY